MRTRTIFSDKMTWIKRVFLRPNWMKIIKHCSCVVHFIGSLHRFNDAPVCICIRSDTLYTYTVARYDGNGRERDARLLNPVFFLSTFLTDF